jgi:hypothetical protein
MKKSRYRIVEEIDSNNISQFAAQKRWGIFWITLHTQKYFLRKKDAEWYIGVYVRSKKSKQITKTIFHEYDL